MPTCPTVAVLLPDGNRAVINEDEFDETIHELAPDEEPQAPQAPAATTSEAEGENTPSNEGEDGANAGGDPQADSIPTRTAIGKMRKGQLRKTLTDADVPYTSEDNVAQLQNRALAAFYPQDE